MLRTKAVPLLCLTSPLFIHPLIPIVIIYWCVLTSGDPSEFQRTWRLAVYGSHCHRSASPLSSGCPPGSFTGPSAPTLKELWSFIQAFQLWNGALWRLPGHQHPNAVCVFVTVCVLHSLLWGKEGAKSRPSRLWGADHHWPPCKCHRQQICSQRDSQSLRYTVFPSHILQPVWLQTAPFHNLLKHFLLLSLSFTCFFFPPHPWSVGCSLPHF